MRLIDPRLVRRFPAVRRFLIASGALALLSAAAIIAQAGLLALAIDRVFLDDARLGAIIGLVGLLVIVAVARGLLAWAFEALGHRAAQSTIRDLRRSFVEVALERRPGAPETASAETATAALRGLDALDPYFARFLPSVVTAIVIPVTIVISVVFLDPLSAIVMVATAPLIPIFGILVGSSASAQARARYAALGRLSGHFLDVVRGLTTLRIFNRGQAQVPLLRETGDAYRLETYRTLRIAFLSSLVLELAATLSVAVIAVEIGIRLVGGSMTFLPALVILILAPELYQPLRNVAAQFHSSADGAAALDRILGPIEAAESAPAPGARTAPDPRTAPVIFHGVGFAYRDRGSRVLDGLDLVLAPGERVALVGPSGAGKSTVARLLLDFETPTQGRISVGGEDLETLDPVSWRARIGWVPQHPVLTSGTIADAIRLGAPDATDGDVDDAIARAALTQTITGLPQGAATRIGEDGRRLSAGQARRVALARALVRDPSLLLLDEPTASLDEESARVIADALVALPRDRTVLLITHDPALAERIADRVVPIEPLPAEVPV